MMEQLLLDVAAVFVSILSKSSGEIFDVASKGLRLVSKFWGAQGLPPDKFDAAVGVWAMELLEQLEADEAEENLHAQGPTA